MSNDSTKKVLLVATSLCVVCSLLVSVAAVALGDKQSENEARARKADILVAAGLMEKGDKKADVNALYENIKAVVIRLEDGEELKEGQYPDSIKPAAYELEKAVKDPSNTVTIPANIAADAIKTAPKVGVIYKSFKDGKLDSVILPIKGLGLWGTMYGFLALEADLVTIKGIVYSKHKETPGLGAEVDNPRWRAQWPDKKAFDERGEVQISVVKGGAPAGSDHAVDGLSGATITSVGVHEMVRFWLGEQGYGHYLDHLKKSLSKGVQ